MGIVKMAVYDVRQFGAAGDGRNKDTACIQRAIDQCALQGGGRVLLSNGTFLTGTLYLKTGVYLEIEAGAVLLASPDIADYGTDTHHNRYRNEPELDRCLIYAQDAENLGLTGLGEINGNAEAFPNPGSIYRPMLIRLLRCKNVRLENLRLYDAAAWTTAFLDSQYLWMRGLDIRNEKRYNGDGLDFDGCHHIWVSDCQIRGTDDNLCLQSGGLPVEAVHISNCSFSSVCAGIRIGLKSMGEIRDVTITNCTMSDIWREGIKIECTEGGTISDILISNITMRNVRRPLFFLLNNRFEPENLGSSLELDHMPEIGKLQRIMVSNLTAVDEACMSQAQYRFGNDIMGEPRFNGIRIDANAEHPIEDVTLSNIRYHSIGGVKRADIPEDYPEVVDRRSACGQPSSENYYPDWSRTAFADIRNVDGLVLENVVCRAEHPDERTPVLTQGCRNVTGEIKVISSCYEAHQPDDQ